MRQTKLTLLNIGLLSLVRQELVQFLAVGSAELRNVDLSLAVHDCLL